MNHLDDELRVALRRKEPPAGFAERVLDRLPATPPGVVQFPSRRRRAPWMAVAAAALVAIAAGSVWLAVPRSAAPQPHEIANVNVSDALPAPPIRPEPRLPAPQVESRIVEPPHRIVRVRHTAPRPAADPEAERAAEQLRLALHIASDKFNDAQRETLAALSEPST